LSSARSAIVAICPLLHLSFTFFSATPITHHAARRVRDSRFYPRRLRGAHTGLRPRDIPLNPDISHGRACCPDPSPTIVIPLSELTAFVPSPVTTPFVPVPVESTSVFVPVCIGL
ncbi:hypothetical protein B0H14DRAFT_1509531, partial [Mycena olivaceomarginata]